MSLSLAVQFASTSKSLPVRAQVRRWALAAHRPAQVALKLKNLDCEITIRYVDEAEGRALNKSFRGKDYATNVLTFVSTPSPWGGRLGRGSEQSGAQPKGRHPHPFRATHETPPSPGRAIKPQVHADIAICAPVVEREAKSQRKTVHAHHAHMVIHGMLHALGFDHENDADAARMETLEIAALQRFRIDNPYQ